MLLHFESSVSGDYAKKKTNETVYWPKNLEC